MFQPKIAQRALGASAQPCIDEIKEKEACRCSLPGALKRFIKRPGSWGERRITTANEQQPGYD